jgi:hypothetical protein
MTFVKGRTKTGGRKKGIPAIAAAGFSAAEACRARGVNPFEVLAEMAAGRDCTDNIRPAAETLCRYLQPQMRPVEVEARRDPAEIVAELKARPEIRQQMREYLEEAERELIVPSPSVH